jgi:hypothetical protein
MEVQKRFQVFVSSTYNDLKDERGQVLAALLKAKCIPIGMELFPASNYGVWKSITQMIDQCDYFVLILAGQYGSVNEKNGLSFTEMEYDRACKQRIPIIAFCHEDPVNKLVGTKLERDARKLKMLERFRAKVMSRTMIREYRTADQLDGLVQQGIAELKDTHPREGWVPAKYMRTKDEQQKLESLRQLNRELEAELEYAKAGKYCAHALDSKANHLACHGLMQQYISESLRTADSIVIKVMAVSLNYSWDFFVTTLPIVFSGTPSHKKISLELEMVDPACLGQLKLRKWKEHAIAVQGQVKQFVQQQKRKGGLIAGGRLEVVLYQYRNIPHWHGMLINNSYIFWGRTKWKVEPSQNIWDLRVGEELYRVFAANDDYGGADRITMFNSWFEFYKHRGEVVVSCVSPRG